MAQAVHGATGLPVVLALLGAVAIAGWIVVAAVHRRLDVFDLIVLGTLAIGLALLTIQRVADSPDAASRDKYGYSVVVLLVLLLIPHLRLPRHPATSPVVLLIGVIVLVVNIVRLDAAIDLNEAVGRHTRATVEAAAAMIQAGEPLAAGAPEVVRRLDAQELVGLIDAGYDPGIDVEDVDPEIAAAARGALRINLLDRVRAESEPGRPPTTTADLDAEGCAPATVDVPLSAEVQGAGTILVRSPRSATVVLTWTDDYGRGVQTLQESAFASTRVVLAEPDASGATLVVSTDAESGVLVCGLAPSGP